MVSHIRADEACHRDLNHHFADIKFYQEVDSHSVTIVTREDEPGTQDDNLPKQRLEFKSQLKLGEEINKSDDEKNTKV